MLSYNVGDVVEYTSRSAGHAVHGVIEAIRDTQAQPLKTGTPESRYLLTVARRGADGQWYYGNIYHHRVLNHFLVPPPEWDDI